MPKYTFKLMSGAFEAREQDPADPKSKILKKYAIGEVVHTDKDLAAKFGPEQFLLVSTNGQAGPAVAALQVPVKPTEPAHPAGAGVGKHEPLENKSVADLQDIAEEEEIDLGQAKLKADIIKVLRGK